MRRFPLIIFLTFPVVSLAQEYARILTHTTVYNIYANQTAEIREHYRLKVNSDKGKDFGVYRDYSDKFRKITDITVDIFDASGKKVKRLNRNDGFETGFNPSYEINDAKTLVIPTEYQQFPYVIEVNSVVRLNGFISLPTWNPRDRFHLAVDYSSLLVKYPKTSRININPLNLTGKKAESGEAVTETFEVAQLQHVDPKVRYRDFYDAQPRVMISPDKFRLDDLEGSFTSWVEFGNWFSALNSDKYILSDKTKFMILSLVQKSDREDIIRTLYEFMQDRTRYVSIQLGVGGFKSLPTEQVEKFGYGDCKALTTYMKSMLDNAGIKSNYVLARAGSDAPDVIKEFPSSQFNHVYLGIPMSNDTLYLECTSQTSPSNYTGTFTDDRNVLWIEPNASKIIRSRTYNHLINKKTSITTIELGADGNATVQTDVENQGVFYDEIMIYNSGQPSDISTYNHEKFSYNDFTLQNFSFNQPRRDNPSFNAKYFLKVNALGKQAGTQMIFPNLPVTPLRNYISQDELKRFYSIKRGITLTDEIEVKLPADFWIAKLPENEKVVSRFGEYNVSNIFDGETLKVKRTIILYKGDYTKEEFDEFKAFYQKIEKIETRKLLFNSKT